MFEIFDPKTQNVPIKVWLEDESQLETECLQQALNLAKLPFALSHIALMPDTHFGFGMPIGGVLATKNEVIPNAVGVDIGCGMCFAETNLHQDDLTQAQLEKLVRQIMRRIPTGFYHHKTKQGCQALDGFGKRIKNKRIHTPTQLEQEVERAYYQVGTLGGGNHFIEIQRDDDGTICLMLHSGSRNFGYKIANYFNQLAKKINKKQQSPVPANFDLAHLSLQSAEGQGYLAWMQLALDFATENRQQMMDVVMDELVKVKSNVHFSNIVNAHHNYAAQEKHFGQSVMVHRKGAIKAAKGELGIVPGAMGSYSYIVEGLGNPQAFNTCSHGAGRKMSRRQAKRSIPRERTLSDLQKLGVVLGKNKKGDVSEESRFAYKDIDFVISQELDLIKPVKRLQTIAVIKG